MLLEKAKMTRYYAPRMTSGLFGRPGELHGAVSFTLTGDGLLLLPLGPGDLGLDPGQRKQPSHTIWPVSHLF